MDKPQRNVRLSIDPPKGDKQPPGFDTVLSILKAERETFPRVQPESQPIARWCSSQTELLWDIMAGQSELVPLDELEAIRLAVPSPPMSQDHSSNLATAVPFLDPSVVEQTIVTMEEAHTSSQNATPALIHIPAEFWEALHAVTRPAPSQVLEALTCSASFNLARDTSESAGSSPMDISPPSPGRLSAPVSPPLVCGDNPSAPVELSSDESSVVQLLEAPMPRGAGEDASGRSRASHDPPLAIIEASSQTPTPSGESDSMGTSGQDAKHVISISSDHSSFHSLDQVSIPDMGPA
jgi:hypothetical protein